MKVKILNKGINISSKLIGFLAVLVFGLIFAIMLYNICSQPTSIKTELQTLTQNIRREYQKNLNYRGLNTLVSIENKLIPAYMVRNGKIFSRIKSEILIGRNEAGDTLLASDTFFSISYLNVNQSKCVSMVSEPFEISLGLSNIQILTPEKSYEFSYGGELPLPLSKQDAFQYCQHKNTVVFSFE